LSTAGRRPDEVRGHNLSAMLRLVHVEGPLSRTALGDALALNRSTIGSLAAELVHLGLVREQSPAVTTAVGRPSLVVGAQEGAVHVLVADVTLHGVTLARVGLGGQVLDRAHEAHDLATCDLAAVVDRSARLARAVERRTRGSLRVGVGASVPGVVRDRDGLVRAAPNLGWVDEPFGERLTRRLRLPSPVRVGNDADLGALAEQLRGAATGLTDLVFLSGQVGLGGGIISGGRPLQGVSGYAGEVGHFVVNPTGRPCRCGARGCWETEVNEVALLGDADPAQVSVQDVVDAALAGDAATCERLDRVGRWLGTGVAGLVNVLNPQAVVFGGHLAVVLPVVLRAVEAQLRVAAMAPHRAAVRLVAAGLGQESSLLGAAELAFAPLLDDPVAHLALVARPVRAAAPAPAHARQVAPAASPTTPTRRTS
jgi:predicted NBD/HSP70 family sugar kinase